MALLVSGPVTSVPAIALLSSVFQRSVRVLDLALGFAVASAAGVAMLALG